MHTTYPPLTTEQQRLVESCLRWAYKLANRFARARGLDYDDCASVACEMLCKAALSHDPAHGCRFVTYCTPAIRWGLQRFAKTTRRRRPVALTDLRRDLPEDKMGDLVDYRSPETASPEARELADRVRRVLPKREWLLLWENKGMEADGRVLGHEHGVSRERIRGLVNRALRRARRLVSAE